MNNITVIYPYYRNPLMLEKHVEWWNEYADWLRPHVKIVIVDDCSPEPAAPIFQHCTLAKELWRVDVDIPWHQHAARNIGAAYAPEGWMFMSDMDISLPQGELAKLVTMKLDEKKHYTFHRVFMDGRPPKYHCNTFLTTRDAYWAVGGYDEDFVGCYGGDGIFLRALERRAPREHREDIRVVGYNDTVPDCSTRDWGRKETSYHKEYLRRRDEKRKDPDGLIPEKPLRTPYRRVF